MTVKLFRVSIASIRLMSERFCNVEVVYVKSDDVSVFLVCTCMYGRVKIIMRKLIQPFRLNGLTNHRSSSRCVLRSLSYDLTPDQYSTHNRKITNPPCHPPHFSTLSIPPNFSSSRFLCRTPFPLFRTSIPALYRSSHTFSLSSGSRSAKLSKPFQYPLSIH
jgi:hypothetical protein